MADTDLSEASAPVEVMIVAAPRAALASMPDDAMVLVSGYEGDMTAAEAPAIVQVRPTDDPEAWYYGEWVSAEAGGQSAVYISGRRHG